MLDFEVTDMNNIAYVLNETEEDGGATTLGVFDSPADIDDDKLREYYGQDAEVFGYIDIRDSGLEWQKKVKHGDGESIVTLHYFTVGEI